MVDPYRARVVVDELFASHVATERLRRWGNVSQSMRDQLVIFDNELLEALVALEDAGAPGATEALNRWADEVFPD